MAASKVTTALTPQENPTFCKKKLLDTLQPIVLELSSSKSFSWSTSHGNEIFVKRTHIAINWQSVAEVLIIVAKAGMSEGQHKRNIKKLPTYLTHFPGRGVGGLRGTPYT